MSAGERGVSDTKIWGPCGHSWLDFACYAVGALDDEIEVRAVEMQAAACAACSDELGDDLEVAGLLYEAVDVVAGSTVIRGVAHPNPQRPPGTAWTARMGGLSCRNFPNSAQR
jgi:hypothetical protein